MYDDELKDENSESDIDLSEVIEEEDEVEEADDAVVVDPKKKLPKDLLDPDTESAEDLAEEEDEDEFDDPIDEAFNSEYEE